jgi:hypothetical protein
VAYARSGVEVLIQSRFWFCVDPKVNLPERPFMKFVSLRTKRHCQKNKITDPARVTDKDFNDAKVASHRIHTYAELRHQIHNDLRIQHPEWIEASGDSPMCDFYEARLMELLGANARGLN